MRVVYNSCNGLQIKDFMQSVARQKRERKKNKMVSSPVERTKVARMLDLLRSWNANFVCMAETQTAWEMYSVREKVGQELRRYD